MAKKPVTFFPFTIFAEIGTQPPATEGKKQTNTVAKDNYHDK
jgi:hypothetical protein